MQTDLPLTDLRGVRQDDYVTGEQFCDFHCIVTDENASNGTAPNVLLIRGSDGESERGDVRHEWLGSCQHEF